VFSKKQKPVPPTLNRGYAESAVVNVGKGRGFKLFPSYVVTVVSCLPKPPQFGSPDSCELYRKVIGPLNEAPAIDARCAFADPVSNLALLTSALGDEKDEYGRTAYEQLVHWESSITVKVPRQVSGVETHHKAAILLPSGWHECIVVTLGGRLYFHDHKDEPCDHTLSGSPIFDVEGGVIGLLNYSSPKGDPDDFYSHHLVLAMHLPFSITSNNASWRTGRAAEGKSCQ
jgi:hypothetical protein